jgi:hypothetical protein
LFDSRAHLASRSLILTFLGTLILLNFILFYFIHFLLLGIQKDVSFLPEATDDWDFIRDEITTNLDAPIHSSKLFIPHLIKQVCFQQTHKQQTNKR